MVLASCTNDGREDFESFVRLKGAEYPDVMFVHDAKERRAERASRALYGVSGIPQQFVIGRDGTVVATVDGYLEGEVLLDAALAKAGIQVDAAILERAAADLEKRQARSKAVVPALPMKPAGKG
ncbi:MAG: hypothetical protein IPK26_21205 [Planctomycetes bacterium]|nr:hypothetical protein [Planctomycetota bacterium]